MYCECGCGQKTPPAPRNDSRGRYKKGDPARYIRGHQSRKNAPQYRVAKNGCWIWLWHADAKGYGQLRRGGPAGGKMDKAHIVYYERAHGPVPTGMELHHTCQNKTCVNPEHLKPVSSAEHARESWPPKRREEQAIRMKRVQTFRWSSKQG